jgi:hypothetical protein
VIPPKDLGSCTNASMQYSVIGALESKFAIDYAAGNVFTTSSWSQVSDSMVDGKLTFSEQQLIDCDNQPNSFPEYSRNEIRNSGCESGHNSGYAAFKYSTKNYLHTSTDYPASEPQVTGTCKYDAASSTNLHANEVTLTNSHDPATIKAAIVQ